MSFDIDRVLLRLNFIQDNLQQLNRFAILSLDDYINSSDIQLITERLLELIIQAAIDINKHLITQGLGLKFPEESRESFIKLWEANILTEDLAKKLSQSAGLRNILAHQYLEIDHSIVHASISKALIQYSLYIQQITAYLDSLE